MSMLKKDIKIDESQIPTFLPRTATQEQRARYYIETRWHDQFEYYTQRAELNRVRHQRLQVFIAVVAVLVPVLLSFTGPLSSLILEVAQEQGLNTSQSNLLVNLINAVPAVLSGLVAVATAVENVQKYGDNWRAFKTAADGMERERALFEANAGPYRRSDNPFKLFVERAEDVISQETGRYFQREGKEEAQGEAEAEISEAQEIINNLMESGKVEDAKAGT